MVNLVILSGWLAFFSFLLMLFTCVVIYCFFGKCEAHLKGKKNFVTKGEHMIFWVENKMEKYHKYIVIATTILILIHVILAIGP